VSARRMKKDQGSTTLLGGGRVPKYHLRCEAYGTLDELNSFIGMARAATVDQRVRDALFIIQNHLFMIGADLALAGRDRSLLKGELGQGEVAWVNRLIHDSQASLKLDPEFIIYGETFPSSVLDVARAVSRRVERHVVRLKSRKMLHNINILEYLNLLSKVLYLLARYEEAEAKVKPKKPDYNLSEGKR